jgi:hypothetical protein
MSDYFRAPPEGSKSFEYLKERGIDPGSANYYGARWTFNPITIDARLGVNGQKYSREVQWDHFFERTPRGARKRGCPRKDTIGSKGAGSPWSSCREWRSC